MKIKSFANGNGQSGGNGAVTPLHLRHDWQTAAVVQAQVTFWTEQA